MYYCVWNQLRESTAEVCGLENIFENTLQVGPRDVVCVDAHRTVAKIQGTNIVEPKDVIRMAVCNQDCIEMFQAVAQSLLPEVGRSIDEN